MADGKPTAELLAPGGGLTQAVYALRAGADAVYAGAARFSARSHAANFGLDDFGRLCGAAEAAGAKVYAALNTVLAAGELGDALDLAWELWERGAAAAIVQDLGLLDLLARRGPPLDLHASTQLAVHSASGARAAAGLGFKRAVLARELSLAEIAAIHRAVPALELECFVAGALCYGVSGLCLASGRLLGRSANRGDCGQVCRSWSVLEGHGGGPGSWFSLNDLDASPRLADLAAAGVSSFKIEGRMKSPEWTRHTVAHFRALLDGDDPGDHAAKARTAFGRSPGPGYLADGKGSGLANVRYAGATGSPLGRIERVEGRRALVALSAEAAVGDGLLALRPGSPPQAWRAALRSIDLPGGGKAWRAGPGGKAWLTAEADGRGWLPADQGLELRKVADHDAALPEVKPGALPDYRRALATVLELVPGGSGGRALRLSLPAWGSAVEIEAELSPATGGQSLAALVGQALAAPGTGRHRAAPVAGLAALEGLFAPPAWIKRLRRAWNDLAAAAIAEARDRARRDLAAELRAAPARPALPPRRELSPAGELPFVVDFPRLAAAGLAELEGGLCLPLAPVRFDDEAGYADLRAWLLGLEDGKTAVLGLGNLAHLDWLDRLLADPEASGRVGGAFADYGLYVANPLAWRLLAERVPRLAGAVGWVEDPAAAPGFEAPLFISRACFRRHGRGEACAGCPRSHDDVLVQGKRRYRVLVRDCVTYVF